MKFRDLLTNCFVETNNDSVIEQYKKYSDRYEIVVDKPAKQVEKNKKK